MAGSIGKHSASYGSASHAEVYRSEANEGCRGVARWAKPGSIGKHSASYGSASHAQVHPSEANEAGRRVARLAKAGPIGKHSPTYAPPTQQHTPTRTHH